MCAISGNPLDLIFSLPHLFRYALDSLGNNIQYALKVGVISAVLIGLTAAKSIAVKRLEFFREAGSGINANAFFTAINSFGRTEHSVQALVAGTVAYWLRSAIAVWHS